MNQQQKIQLPEHLRCMVFGGGGTNGASHIGVIHAIEQHYKTNRIYDISGLNSYIGVSVGSIICLLCICGLKSDEMLDIVYNFELNSITNSIGFTNLIDGYGFASFDCIRTVLENAIVQKGFCKDITMKELYNITHKQLIVSSTCMNSYSTQYFDYESTPNMKVMDVVQMSCAVPLVFKSVKMDNKIFVDGGMLEQIPTALVKDDNNTICIIIHRDYDASHNVSIANVEEYLLNFASCMYINYEKIQVKSISESFKLATIIKIKGGMNPVNCSLTKHDFYEMYLDGFCSIYNF